MYISFYLDRKIELTRYHNIEPVKFSVSEAPADYFYLMLIVNRNDPLSENKNDPPPNFLFLGHIPRPIILGEFYS